MLCNETKAQNRKHTFSSYSSFTKLEILKIQPFYISHLYHKGKILKHIFMCFCVLIHKKLPTKH